MNFINETLDILNTNDKSYPITIKKPKLCSFCHKESNQIIHASTKIDYSCFAIVTKCSICNNFNLHSYRFRGVSIARPEYIQHSLLPKIDNCLNDALEELSPLGCKTYKEALIALTLSLEEVAGMAIRKAIECFIKDFLIKFLGENKDSVIKMPLAAAIREIKDAPKLVSLADTVRELGNDSTHYSRRYESIGVIQMKQFADYLIEYIKTEIKLKETAL